MHRTNRHTRSILAAAISITLFGTAATTRATDGSWVGGGGNTSWSNAGNWTGGVIADGTDANATFSLDFITNQTVTVDTARTVGNLSFSDTDPTPAGNWVLNSPGPLTLAVSSGTPTITANSLGTGNLVQFNVPLAGTQGVQIAGSSPVFFNGANTFTGGLTIPAGSTVIAGAGLVPGATNAASISASDAVAVNGSLLLRASSGANNVIYSLSGSGTIGADAAATGYLSFRVKQGSFSGNIVDAPNGGTAHIGLLFDSTAAGLIDLSGNNTYSGDTLVRTGGTLRLSSPTALPALSLLRLQPGTNITSTLILNANAGGDFVRKLGGTSSAGTGGTLIGSNNTNNVVNFGNIGQDRKITFTDGTNSNPVTIKWSSVSTDNFTPSVLGLGTTDSTNTINFTNPIDLNGAGRTININNGSAAIDVEMSGSFSNSSATAATLAFNGTGTLLLSGNNSANASAVTINTPVVRLASSSSLGTSTTIGGGTANTGRIELTDGQNISSPISVAGRSGAVSLAPAISGASGNSTYSGTLTTAGGGNLYNISADAGSLTIAGTINNAAGSGRFLQFMGAAQGYVTSNIQSSLTVNKYGTGTWTFSGPANTYTGATSVFAGTLNFASSQVNTSSITVSDGAKLNVSPGGDKTIKTSTLTFTGSGTLDLADNKLALTAGNYLDILRGMLSFGYSGGSWSGFGVTSSSAAAQPNHITAIGYALASDLGVSTWGSASVAAGNTVAKYTYYGDANLNGKIDADDYALLDKNFAANTPNAHWTNGDFNYDGVVDQNDYLLIDTTLGIQQGGHLSPDFLSMRESQFGDAYVSALVASVPEPASLMISAFALAPALTRRRRR